MKDLIGTNLGHYEIKEKIGQGGMAFVYKAFQPGLNRLVAIKILPPGLAEEPGFTERFQREAQAIARLHHPNILQVYDYGIQDNYNYLVMRYVENSITLGKLIRDGAPVDKLIEYIMQVADALNYAHEHGIIHRDVKPSNILIDGKWALLSDFGLVKTREAASQLTGTGVGMGTPAYMSPEQASGAKIVDHRTDIYALGIILHRVLTGSIPHDAPTPLAILVKRSTEPVPMPRQIKPEIPESVEHVVLRSLAREPDARYSSATDFAEALRKARQDPNFREESIPTMYAVSDATIARTPPPPPPPPAQTIVQAAPRRNLSLIIGGAIAAVVIIIGALIFLLVTMTRTDNISAGQPPTETADVATNTAAPAVAVEATDTPIPPTDTPTSVPTPIPPGTPSALAKADLEVYSGPGEIYQLLGFLPEGAKAEITGRDRDGQWWQIRTTLTATGVAWIKVDPNLAEVIETNNIPIALAPPTPTDTPTSIPDSPTPTATPQADTPTATNTTTPTRSVAVTTPAAPAAPTATSAPAPPSGEITLIKPVSLDNPSFGMTEFEWRWSGPIAADQGFEVRVWREGEPPAGVHNAVEDNQKGVVASLGNNTYRLNADIRDSFGVKGRTGEYWWTVALVQISPEYKDLGVQANPGRLRFEAGGSSGGGGDGGSSGGGTTY